MLTVATSTQFERDAKLAKRRHKDLSKLREVVALLENEQPLPERCRDHVLSGGWAQARECHIEPDWLLVYRVDAARKELVLVRTGTHADLF